MTAQGQVIHVGLAGGANDALTVGREYELEYRRPSDSRNDYTARLGLAGEEPGRRQRLRFDGSPRHGAEVIEPRWISRICEVPRDTAARHVTMVPRTRQRGGPLVARPRTCGCGRPVPPSGANGRCCNHCGRGQGSAHTTWCDRRNQAAPAAPDERDLGDLRTGGMLRVLRSYCPDDQARASVTGWAEQAAGDGATPDQVVAMLAGWLLDGLVHGNWPWAQAGGGSHLAAAQRAARRAGP